MKKRIVLVLFVVLLLLVPTSALAGANGFDQYGYNRTARIFNGTGMDWCLAKGLDQAYCDSYLGDSANDHLVMKWSKEWDRGNAENWELGPYTKAWTSNEWNGAFPGGSGDVWHYKIIWVGTGLEDSPYWREGGYAIWGQFEVIMDQGMSGGVHEWFAHGEPSGYGSPNPK